MFVEQTGYQFGYSLDSLAAVQTQSLHNDVGNVTWHIGIQHRRCHQVVIFHTTNGRRRHRASQNTIDHSANSIDISPGSLPFADRVLFWCSVAVVDLAFQLRVCRADCRNREGSQKQVSLVRHINRIRRNGTMYDAGIVQQT